MAPRAAVLFVEDDCELIEICSLAFAEIGIDLVSTTDRAEVARVLAQRRFMMVFFELMLPHWDGIESVRALRRLTAAPIIVFGGLIPGDEEVAALRTAGASDLLVMPFDVDDILNRVLRPRRGY